MQRHIYKKKKVTNREMKQCYILTAFRCLRNTSLLQAFALLIDGSSLNVHESPSERSSVAACLTRSASPANLSELFEQVSAVCMCNVVYWCDRVRACVCTTRQSKEDQSFLVQLLPRFPLIIYRWYLENKIYFSAIRRKMQGKKVQRICIYTWDDVQ